MTRFFENVFMFSITDNEARTGIHANANHIFALGCGKTKDM